MDIWGFRRYHAWTIEVRQIQPEGLEVLLAKTIPSDPLQWRRAFASRCQAAAVKARPAKSTDDDDEPRGSRASFFVSVSLCIHALSLTRSCYEKR